MGFCDSHSICMIRVSKTLPFATVSRLSTDRASVVKGGLLWPRPAAAPGLAMFRASRAALSAVSVSSALRADGRAAAKQLGKARGGCWPAAAVGGRDAHSETAQCVLLSPRPGAHRMSTAPGMVIEGNLLGCTVVCATTLSAASAASGS